MESLKNTVSETVAYMKSNSRFGSKIIMQCLIDALQVKYNISIDEIEQESFDNLLVFLEIECTPASLNSIQLRNYDNFINLLCKKAYIAGVLVNSSGWLRTVFVFLNKVHEKDSLKYIPSRLALPFLKVLCKIRIEIGNVIRASSSITQRRTLTEQALINLQNISVQKKREIDSIDKHCDTLFNLVDIGVLYKNIVDKIVIEICEIHETTSAFYIRNMNLLNFYLQCFKTKKFKITVRALESIEKIITNPALLDEEREVVINFFDQKRPSCFLCHLIFEPSPTIVQKTLNLLYIIHEYIGKMKHWTNTEYNRVFMKTLDNNDSVRKAAGNLFIKYISQKTRNDAEILLELLDFYMKYNSDVNKMDNYMQALWDFDYMKHFENSLALFTGSDPNSQCQCTVAHFIVTMAREMNKQKDNYEDELLYLIKKLPLIIEGLQNEPTVIGILLQVCWIVGLESYEPIKIGNARYIDRLAKALVLTLSQSNLTYKLSKNVFITLHKLCELNFDSAKLQMSLFIDKIYNSFVDVFTSCEKEFFLIEIELIKQLENEILKISLILCYPDYLNSEQENHLFTTFRNNLVVDKFFKQISDNYGYNAETFAITAYSDILKRSILKCFKSSHILVETMMMVSVEMLKKYIEEFLIFLKEALTRENTGLVFKRNAFDALIFVLLATQRKLFYSTTPEIKALLVNMTKQQYYTIISTVADVIKSENTMYEQKNLEDIEQVKMMLKHLNLLHEHHIGIPYSTQAWKIMTAYVTTQLFKTEIRTFIKILLQYETPTEEKGSRFCKIFAATILQIGSPEFSKNHNIHGILKKYKQILDEELPKKEIDLIIAGSVMNLFDLLSKKLEVTAIGKDNRLYILPFIKELTMNLGYYYKKQIKTQLTKIKKVLVFKEYETYKKFEESLQIEPYSASRKPVTSRKEVTMEVSRSTRDISKQTPSTSVSKQTLSMPQISIQPSTSSQTLRPPGNDSLSSQEGNSTFWSFPVPDVTIE